MFLNLNRWFFNTTYFFYLTKFEIFKDINLFFDYIAHADFSSLKSNINEYNTQIINKRTGKKVSILNEVMRSAQEVQIANFLYMHKIDYEYEPIYPYHILKNIHSSFR